MPEQSTNLVRGATVCVTDDTGELRAEAQQGVYHRDIRVLSRLRLTVDGHQPQLLSSRREGADGAHQVFAAATDPHGTPTALLLRHRRVDGSVRDRYEVRTFAAARNLVVELDLEADFAPLVKGASPRPSSPWTWDEDPPTLAAGDERVGVHVDVDGPAPQVCGSRLRWQVAADPGVPWRLTLRIRPRWQGRLVGPMPRTRVLSGGLHLQTPALAWSASVASALADLDALRVHLEDLDLRYVGAGAPWFMALFGRDSLIAAWFGLIAGTDLALEVLQALARYQGRQVVPEQLEEPGKILHELRTGGLDVFGVQAGAPYYGSVDACPLFVWLLGEAYRWGADPARVRTLLPAARAALEWCERFGDRDGDGFIEYVPHAAGLENQGWKDSGNPIVHADGSIATGPIALCEVQGYWYAAYGALAMLERRVGEPTRAEALDKRAAALRRRFRERFWFPDEDDDGLLAMALDGRKEPLRVAASNMGHCLWSGILDEDVAAAVAARLVRPDLLAASGVRTLSTEAIAYNPLGYHLGSIWPHDSAIAAAGLARYGHVEEACMIIERLLGAAERTNWRLPELYGELDDGEHVPYPEACSPQAWSAAVPLLLLRTVLRLDPDVPTGEVRIEPVFGGDVAYRVGGLSLGQGTLSFRGVGVHLEELDLPDGLRLRPPAPK